LRIQRHETFLLRIQFSCARLEFHHRACPESEAFLAIQNAVMRGKHIDIALLIDERAVPIRNTLDGVFVLDVPMLVVHVNFAVMVTSGIDLRSVVLDRPQRLFDLLTDGYEVCFLKGGKGGLGSCRDPSRPAG